MTRPRSRLLALGLALVAIALFSPVASGARSLGAESPRGVRGDELRVCAGPVERASCPTDTPEFASGTEEIHVSMKADGLPPGAQVRFSWYRLDDTELFSTFLGSTYASARAAYVMAGFPAAATLSDGVYEVLVQLPGGEKPILKTFKIG